MLMGYDEHGRCPMLIDNACSIYADRPQTCRTYDCRVFAAAELDATDDGKPEIAQRARRWDFSYADENARTRQAAVAAAAAFVRARRSEFPEGSLPPTVTHLAVLAVRVHEAFLNHEGDDVRLIFPSVNDVVSRR